jgi:hypothetical protein
MNATSPQQIVADYSPEEERPLGPYVLLTSIFAAGFAGGLEGARRSRGSLPDRYGVLDLIMVGAATHKLSRLITKDKVTSFLRAPFTRFQEASGQGEVEEAPRGEGMRYAVGELLVCPYCVGQWVAGAFVVGMVGAPRLTRTIAFMYTAETAADFLQLAYLAAEERAEAA